MGLLRIITAITFLLGTSFTVVNAKDNKNNEKKRAVAAAETYFEGDMTADFEPAKDTLVEIKRYYDRKHRVVCYRFGENQPVSCASSNSSQ